jgi:uncharacterized RmlC-like cupin family protein
MSWGEYEKWKAGSASAPHYQTLVDDAKTKPERDAQRKKIIKPHEFPWENSPHGLLKHLVNEWMDARCDTLDAYMQIIPPGSRSGKRRQLAEQAVYIVEGRGYDLHVDCDLEIVDGEKYSWRPDTEAKRFDWEAGDVVYIPPNTIVQHFNADPDRVARIIVATNRIYKQSGLNDLEQIETAPEYNPNEVLNAETIEKYLKPR